MKTLYFDGYSELAMSGMVVNDRGQIVPRDDYETYQEILEALREEQFRRRQVSTMCTMLACGLLAALLILAVGGRLPL